MTAWALKGGGEGKVEGEDAFDMQRDWLEPPAALDPNREHGCAHPANHITKPFLSV